MRLRSTLTSPFGRKVRMALLRLGIHDRVDIQPADPLDPQDSLRVDNPIGKMPVLFTDDGLRLYDSRTILDYLNHLPGGDWIIPAAYPERGEVLTLTAMCDAATDAALLIVYEARHRPEALHHAPWLDYQRGKIVRTLAELERAPPDPTVLNAGTMAMACMFGYLDWRHQVDWRPQFPALVAWLDAFAASHREWAQTAA